jgi:hypothetical protein
MEDKVKSKVIGSIFWWKFDLLDENGDVAGGGMVLAAGPAGALAHAQCLAGNCAVRLHEADGATSDRVTPHVYRDLHYGTGRAAIPAVVA